MTDPYDVHDPTGCGIGSMVLRNVTKARLGDVLTVPKRCRSWRCEACARSHWSVDLPHLKRLFENGSYAGVCPTFSSISSSTRESGTDSGVRHPAWDRIRQQIRRAEGGWARVEVTECWVLSNVEWHGSNWLSPDATGRLLARLSRQPTRTIRVSKDWGPLPHTAKKKPEWSRVRNISTEWADRIVHNIEYARDQSQIIDLPPRRSPEDGPFKGLSEGNVQRLVDAAIRLQRREETEVRKVESLPAGWENMNAVQLLRHGSSRVLVERLTGLSEEDVLELRKGVEMWWEIEHKFG